MKKACLIFAILPLAVACSKSTENNSSLRDDLIGEWRNIYLDVTIHSFKNDSSKEKIVQVDSSSREDSLHIKPIRTFFNADSTYHSDYYNLKDSLMFSSSGNWEVVGDTLFMYQNNPKVTQFEGLLDFDEDGKADDHYLGGQRRQYTKHYNFR